MASEKRRVSRRRVPLTSLVPAGSDETEIRKLVDELASTGLIVKSAPSQPSADDTAEEQGGVSETWVEVAHEELLRNWQRLHTSLDAHAELLLLRQEVGDDARDWWNSGGSTKQREPELLNHRGTKLRAALPLLENHGVPLNTMESAYLSACQELERQERERERRRVESERRYIRNLGRALGAVGVMLCVAVITAGVALRERNRAQKQTGIAQKQTLIAQKQTSISTSQKLAAQARVQMPQRLDTALLLSKAAWEQSPTDEAQAALLDSLSRCGRLRAFLHLPKPKMIGSEIVFHPNRNLLLVTGGYEAIYQYNTNNPTQDPQIFQAKNFRVMKALYSPDGKTVLAIASERNNPKGNSHCILHWDTDTTIPLPKLKIPVDVPDQDVDSIKSIVCSRDRLYVAAVTYLNKVLLWKQKQGTQKYTFQFHKTVPHSSESLAFSADGNYLLSINNMKQYLRFRIDSRECEFKSLEKLSNSFGTAKISTNGLLLARHPAGGRYISLQKLACDGRLLDSSERMHAERQVTWFTLRADGKQAFGYSSEKGNGWLSRWGVPGGSAPLRLQTLSAIDALAVSPDGKTIAAGVDEQRIALYNFDNEKEHPLFESIPPASDSRSMPHFNAKGNLLFFCQRSRQAKQETYVLENKSEHLLPHLQELIERKGYVIALSFTDDIALSFAAELPYIALQTEDGHLLLWNYKDDKPLCEPLDSVIRCKPVLSRDGRMVVSLDPNGKTVLREISPQGVLEKHTFDAPNHDPFGTLVFNFLPEGDQIAVAYATGEIRFYNVSDGKQARDELSLRRAIGMMAISSSGATIFANSDEFALINGNFSLLDGRTGQPIGEASHASRSGIESMTFDAPRQKLLLYSRSGSYRGDMNPDNWKKLAQKIANRLLSPQERKDYGIPAP